MEAKQVKLFDSELKVMEVLWREGPATAKNIASVLSDEVGWNVNTTRTLIKRCIEKGAIERTEPHFMCRALITKGEVQEAEAAELVDRVFDGSPSGLVAALLNRTKLSREEIERLKRIVDELE